MKKQAMITSLKRTIAKRQRKSQHYFWLWLRNMGGPGRGWIRQDAAILRLSHTLFDVQHLK